MAVLRRRMLTSRLVGSMVKWYHDPGDMHISYDTRAAFFASDALYHIFSSPTTVFFEATYKVNSSRQTIALTRTKGSVST